MADTTADATARLALMQRMAARSRAFEHERNDDAARRREALRRAGLREERDDLATLVVPAQRNPLVAVTVERKRWLRRHLVRMLRAHATAAPASASAPVPAPGPAPGTHAEPSVIGQRACALCQGACCGYGGDQAYLTPETIARVAGSGDSPSPSHILQRYMANVPAEAVRGSCIFHGAQGCTLDRTLRADVCNRHHCPPLRGYLRHAAPRDVLVMAVADAVLYDACVVTSEEQR